jgi:hypothetical protein
MHPTVPPRTCAPWSSSIGIDGRHASEPVVFFVGMPTRRKCAGIICASRRNICAGCAHWHDVPAALRAELVKAGKSRDAAACDAAAAPLYKLTPIERQALAATPGVADAGDSQSKQLWLGAVSDTESLGKLNLTAGICDQPKEARTCPRSDGSYRLKLRIWLIESTPAPRGWARKVVIKSDRYQRLTCENL